MADIDDPIHTHYLLLALTESLKCETTPTAFSVGCVLTVPSSALHNLLPPALVNALPWTWSTQNVNHTSTNTRVLSTGYSRELQGNTHAEANAINKAIGLLEALAGTQPAQTQPPPPGGYGYGYAGASSDARPDLGNEPQVIEMDLYTTLEPCSTRTSGLQSCTQTILGLNAANNDQATVQLRVRRVFIGASEPPDFVLCEGAKLLAVAGVQVIWLGSKIVKLAEVDLNELVEPGGDGSEDIELGEVCLRAARRNHEGITNYVPRMANLPR